MLHFLKEGGEAWSLVNTFTVLSNFINSHFEKEFDSKQQPTYCILSFFSLQKRISQDKIQYGYSIYLNKLCQSVE